MNTAPAEMVRERERTVRHQMFWIATREFKEDELSCALSRNEESMPVSQK